MSNRIDDQNLRDRMYEDRSHEIKKQSNKQDFAEKFATQKGTQKQGEIQTSQSKAKAGAAKTTVPTAKLPQQPKAVASTPQKTQTKKADEKGDAKKHVAADAKEDKKRTDLSVETAIKKKHDSGEEEGGGFKESDNFFQQAAMAGIVTPSQVSETASATPPALSQEVINQLVDSIHASTNTEGLKELTIELKSGVLSGAQIQVSTSGGKVKLKIKSDNSNTKALLRNSKDAIAKRLEQKNLSLSEFVVD